MVKARTSAAALVEAGHVRINGVREKAPGHSVKAGDVLIIGPDRSVRVLKVVGFSERRGDAASARVLDDDLQAGQEERTANSRLQEEQTGKNAFPECGPSLRLRCSCASDPRKIDRSEPWMNYVVTEACIKCN